jgi:tetratricopeptide (TPR) repeat protein
MLGSGKMLWHGRIGRIEICVNFWPGGGLTFTYPNPHLLRLTSCLVLLAGPMMHAVLLALSFYWLPANEFLTVLRGFLPGHSFLPRPSWQQSVALVFILANALMLALSLWLVWNMLRMTDDALRASQAMRCVYECMRAGANKEYEEAVRWCQEGLEQCPDHPLSRRYLAIGYRYLNDFNRAREELLSLLRDTGAKPEDFLPVLTQLITVDLLSGADELLLEADTYSAKAHRFAPWDGEHQAMRGCVLIRLGKIEEAVALLQSALKEAESASTQAWAAAYLALAEAERGHVAESKRYLARARKLDSDCPAIGAVEKTIAGLVVGN